MGVKKKTDNTRIILIIVACIIIIIGGSFITNMSESKDIENTQNSYDTAVFETSTIKINNLETSTDKQTFTVLLENTSDTSVSVIDYSFKIESNDNIYSSELFKPADYDVNPNMNTTIKIDFNMPLSALEESDANLVISSFYFSQEQDIPLNK